MPLQLESAIQELIAVGRRLDLRGLAPATSGNYSARVDEDRIAITVSGSHKGRLSPADLMLVDLDGRALNRMEKAGATIVSSNQAVAELVGSWASEEGGQIVQLIMQVLMAA